MLDVEPIATALYTQLTKGIVFPSLPNGATQWKTTARKWIPWSKLTPEQQPALMLVQKHVAPKKDGRGIPSTYHLFFDAVIYVNCTGDRDNTTPATYLNGLVKAVEGALDDSERGPQTLGGLVSHCFLSGDLKYDEGVLDMQGWAVLQIEVVFAA